jgi:hypothetical protein
MTECDVPGPTLSPPLALRRGFSEQSLSCVLNG